jgi:1,4-dihydroxy-2-naphthoate octaprenyltransferase
MASLQSWVKAARLRTLPLALASVAMGAFVAASTKGFKLEAAVWAGITTVLLQILSNFANDYGDTVTGIDNDQRVGPKRTVQAGEISKNEMLVAIYLASFLSFISGLILLFWISDIGLVGQIGLLLAGIAAITAAIRYTVGENPYGYRGLGDLNVFLFFGIAAVAGTFFLSTNTFTWEVLLPASAMGLLSVAVLNLNNLRDFVNDRYSGKRTIVVSLGYSKALFYHAFLVLFPFLLLVVYSLLQGSRVYQFAYLLLLPLFIADLVAIFKSPGDAHLDPFLKKHALKTLLLTCLFGLLLLL